MPDQSSQNPRQRFRLWRFTPYVILAILMYPLAYGWFYQPDLLDWEGPITLDTLWE
jgi:hypothetical protein